MTSQAPSAFWFLCLGFSALSSAVVAQTKAIVINEIHYDPASLPGAEYIELHNASKAAISLAGWQFTQGIRYEFPQGTSVASGGFLVVAKDPDAVEAAFGINALGPWEGKLSNGGETLELVDSTNQLVDRIPYDNTFPWPLAGGSDVECSIELLNPSIDNSLGGHWRSSISDLGTVTPGRRNHAYTENAPPAVHSVQQSPKRPRSGEPVTLTLKVSDPDGVASVKAEWQVVEPGDYFSRYQTATGEEPLQADPRFEAKGSWTVGEMRSEDDGSYRIQLASELQRHRRLIRYRFRLSDTRGATVSVPLPNEAQPNFAYFVYDALPNWKGRLAPGTPERVYPAEALSTVPVYHLLAKAEDVRESQFDGYRGSAYRWTGTLVVDGDVYDHIGFRPRGGTHRFRRGKNFWKFNFNRGRRFLARDAYGQPYPTAWDKLNLSSGMQNIHMTMAPRGEHGLFEAASFRLFNLAGVEAPMTHFVHFRIIDGKEESPANQYEGDFNGLYLAIEQMDRRFLKAHELPDGNLYKIEYYEGDKKVQGPGQSLDASDLAKFNRALERGQRSPDWWRRHFELDHYYSYRSVVECVRHYDMAQGKNHYYYHHPENDRWRILPWDVDITWAEGQYGTGDHRLRSLVAKNPAFRQDYQNRLREIMDLLYNPEQTGMLIDELAHPISTPDLNLASADDALWDHHPANALPGASYEFYKSQGFEPTVHGAVAYMKSFVKARRALLQQQLLRDERFIPVTPKILKMADGTFHPIPFAGRGDATFAGLAWRIAEVSNPSAPTFDPREPRRYEIQPLWESGELPPTKTRLTLPKDLELTTSPNTEYRLRLRMKDSNGRWSHWSPPEPLH